MNDVKKLRSILGISQRELAEKLGVSVRTIANYEGGGIIPSNKQILINRLLSDARNISVKGDYNITNTGVIEGEIPNYTPKQVVETLVSKLKKLEEENEQLKKDKVILQEFVTLLQNQKKN